LKAPIHRRVSSEYFRVKRSSIHVAALALRVSQRERRDQRAEEAGELVLALIGYPARRQATFTPESRTRETSRNPRRPCRRSTASFQR
jgi:hypothetical protein